MGTAALMNPPFSLRCLEQPQCQHVVLACVPDALGRKGCAGQGGQGLVAFQVTKFFSSGCWWSPAWDIPAWLKLSNPSWRCASRRRLPCVEPAAGSNARWAPALAATRPGGVEKDRLSPRDGEHRLRGGSEVVKTI